MSVYNIPQAFLNKVKEKVNLLSKEELDLSEKRLAICSKCPKQIEDDLFKTATCSICGCYLKLKTLVKEEVCDDKKW